MSRFRLILPLALLGMPLAACADDEPSDDTAAPNSPATSAADSEAPADGECEYVAEGSSAKEVELPPSTPEPAESLVITTGAGEITVELTTESAPCTTGSVSSLAEQGYFDGTQCHRLTTEGIFVLQCGDPTATGTGGPGYRFADELSGEETYPAGTLAMANAGPDTNGSQFFIVYEDTGLPPSYTVFGTIDDAGLEVVRGIADKGTESGAGDGPPADEVVIESVG